MGVCARQPEYTCPWTYPCCCTLEFLGFITCMCVCVHVHVCMCAWCGVVNAKYSSRLDYNYIKLALMTTGNTKVHLGILRNHIIRTVSSLSHHMYCVSVYLPVQSTVHIHNHRLGWCLCSQRRVWVQGPVAAITAGWVHGQQTEKTAWVEYCLTSDCWLTTRSWTWRAQSKHLEKEVEDMENIYL